MWQEQMRLYLSSQSVFLDLRVKPNEKRIIKKKKKKKKKAHWELSMVLTWAYVCLPCMQGNLAHRSLDLSKCSSNPTDLVACLQPKGF